jgi:hypothetical protein
VSAIGRHSTPARGAEAQLAPRTVLVYCRRMIFLVVVGVLLLVACVAIVRHSRNFRGSGRHFESEERPDVHVSKALPRNDSGIQW